MKRANAHIPTMKRIREREEVIPDHHPHPRANPANLGIAPEVEKEKGKVKEMDLILPTKRRLRAISISVVNALAVTTVNISTNLKSKKNIKRN